MSGLDSSGLAQPSGSEVSKVESDIYQTISLAGTVITLVREPISLLYNNINKTKKLKQSLGVWQTEALDKNDQSRIPVLRLLEYEDHLVTNNGKVEYLTGQAEKRVSLPEKVRLFWSSGQQLPSPMPPPKLPDAGAACWNYFLYALGIGPGMDVVNWKPSMDGYLNTQNGGVEMEIDGSVLCHIMNLYSTPLNCNLWARRSPEEIPDRRKTKICKFPFGELAWNTVDGQIHAHFTPGLEKELGSTKIPLGDAGAKLQPGTAVASYLVALSDGVSDAKFQLAKPTASISDRMDRLVTSFKALARYNSTSAPLIISGEWFEEAARVKKRVLADGGSDRSFYDDIIKALERNKGKLSPGDIAYHKCRVRDLFLFDEELFEFYLEGYGIPSVPPASACDDHWADKAVEEVLESYKDYPPETWKFSLFNTKEKVLQLFCIPRRVYLKQTLLLQEFTSSCELWNEKVLLGAPVHVCMI